jgi:RNA polymerase sigma factor (TIGR02999 family)
MRVDSSLPLTSRHQRVAENPFNSSCQLLLCSLGTQQGREMTTIEPATRSDSAASSDIASPRQLFVDLYSDLHRIAVRELRRHAAGSVSPTTLLHETFLKLDPALSMTFGSKGRFVAYAARAMRSLLIDELRRRQAQKRGGEYAITELHTETPVPDQYMALEQLSDALDALATIEPRLAQCVDLKFFCGYSFIEIAQMWNVSERTVQRDWDKARLLLNRFINDGSDPLQPT